MVSLDDRPIFTSTAYGVSADGTVVVGSAQLAYGTTAFRWDATNGMQNIMELLEFEGIDLTGWWLVKA